MEENRIAVDEKEEQIILNSVFVGGYGHNKGNLPHEMINFFQEDTGKYYVYITPYGVLKETLGLKHIKCILFVRNVGNALIEVLAKAVINPNDEDCEFYTQGVTLNQQHKIKEKNASKENVSEFKEKIENIRYGKKQISEIHKGNHSDNDIFITMKVSEICLPKQSFYITTKEDTAEKYQNTYFIGDKVKLNGIEKENQSEEKIKKLANQSMKAYFYDGLNGYNKLKEIVEDSKLWESKDKTPKYDEEKAKASLTNSKNFFKITRKQDDEVMFSNMFYYLFTEYPTLLQAFCSQVLELDVKLEAGKYQVEREKDRMDLRVIGDDYYIILENKIKSSINGMHSQKEDEKNAEKNKKKAKEKDKNIVPQEEYSYKNGYRIDNDEKYISQLCVYYGKAIEKMKAKERVHAFILAPNYMHIDKSFLDRYSKGEQYNPITYKKIYEFLKDFADKNAAVGKDVYLQELIKGLLKHTTDADNEYRDELMARLYNRIKEK